ncbi:hypothetical protein ACFO25_14205 [Paenactinomyces guangxiensis]|uniref:Uncharacterized protein n=1 Tax=Paenactinomyces guangxiensis TaxID=1490290 RepID=A0A7W2A700_9BACL|nr:hypothetical protein [Paenactinomyces guangxiensis]MBA4493981.1 hypothetical protein [Paenactinomyces guangxiensis]MBH8593402.1 hypothetical protein [Paenactinomyces guangxiensis]
MLIQAVLDFKNVYIDGEEKPDYWKKGLLDDPQDTADILKGYELGSSEGENKGLLSTVSQYVPTPSKVSRFFSRVGHYFREL